MQLAFPIATGPLFGVGLNYFAPVPSGHSTVLDRGEFASHIGHEDIRSSFAMQLRRLASPSPAAHVRSSDLHRTKGVLSYTLRTGGQQAATSLRHI